MPVFTAIVAVAGFLGTVGAGTAALVGVSLATSSVVAVAVGGALIGAAVGAVSSAVQGKSVLKGALKGGLIGAAVGGALGMGAQSIMAKELAASQAITQTAVAEGEMLSAAGAEAAFGVGDAATVAAAETGATGAAAETVATAASAAKAPAIGGTAAKATAAGEKAGLLAGMSGAEKATLIGGGLKAVGKFFEEPEDPNAWKEKYLNESAGEFGADFMIHAWDDKFDGKVFGNGIYQGILADNPTDSNLYQAAKGTFLQGQQNFQQTGNQPVQGQGAPTGGNQFAPPAGPGGTTINQPAR
jgi:hypothetical protein